MSVIRPLKPRQDRHVCPDCGAPEGLVLDADKHVICKLCDWKSPVTTKDHIQVSEEQDTHVRELREFKNISHYIENRDAMKAWTLSAYESALQHIKNREWDEAIVDLYRVLEMDSQVVEAYLWLGRLLTDESQQREYLSKIGHRYEAVLELMYLDGEISLTELEDASASKSITDPISEPVTPQMVILSCPICGGHMTTHPTKGHIECAFCGHIDEPDEDDEIIDSRNFLKGIQFQRTQIQHWDVEQRIIHCDQCGSERVSKDFLMVSHCIYCGSKQVTVADSANSFHKPDGIIPFTVPEEQAEMAINQRLHDKWERFRGLFFNNDVEQATLIPTYIPFWIFTFKVEVKQRGRGDQIRFRQADTHFLYPAVLSPPPRLISKIKDFNLNSIKNFKPGYLASHSMEMYQIDFDKASLEARTYIRRIFQHKYTNTDPQVAVSHRWAIVNDMQYRLILLPFWVATIIEDDGDVRVGLINGQDGHAVLGKARQPNQFFADND